MNTVVDRHVQTKDKVLKSSLCLVATVVYSPLLLLQAKKLPHLLYIYHPILCYCTVISRGTPQKHIKNDNGTSFVSEVGETTHFSSNMHHFSTIILHSEGEWLDSKDDAHFSAKTDRNDTLSHSSVNFLPRDRSSGYFLFIFAKHGTHLCLTYQPWLMWLPVMTALPDVLWLISSTDDFDHDIFIILPSCQWVTATPL